MPADGRQVGAEAAVLCHRRAERIAHQRRGLAARLHQAGGTAVARAVELERIGLAAVDAADDEIDALQALERLQEQTVAGGAQISTFDQQISEVAREICMAEIVVVVRSGRQQRDARIAASGEHGEVGLHLLEEGGEARAVARLEQVAGDVRVHHAVGERIADAGGRLGMVVDDAPASVGFARQVDGVEVQVARLRHDAVAGAEERGVGKKERGRDEAIAQQLLLAVGVGEDGV